MAVTLGTADVVTRGTTDSTTDELIKITLASGVKWIVLQFITNAGKLAHTGTDGSAIGSAYLTLTAGTPYRLYVGGSAWGDATKDIYITSATGSTAYELVQELAG